jgi:hypothetical protein
MKLPHRRQFLHLTAGAAALPVLPRIVWAQAYPTRPVRIIDGFAAGGPADIVARLIAQWLSERLGQPFVVESRPGAAGNIGTEAVVRAPADGYTLLLAATPAAINATLYEKLNYFDGRPQLGFENELGSDRGVNTFQATRRAQDHRTAPSSNEPITARQVSQRVAVCGLGASANGPSAPARRKCARWPPCHAARAGERGACRRRRASASPSARRLCRRSRRAGLALSRFSGSAGRSR